MPRVFTSMWDLTATLAGLDLCFCRPLTSAFPIRYTQTYRKFVDLQEAIVGRGETRGQRTHRSRTVWLFRTNHKHECCRTISVGAGLSLKLVRRRRCAIPPPMRYWRWCL